MPSLVRMSIALTRSPVPVLSHRTLEQIGDVELLADVARVDRLSLERERRRSRRDAQSGNLGERADEIVRDAVGEILLRGVAAEIRERQNGDRLRLARARPHGEDRDADRGDARW